MVAPNPTEPMPTPEEMEKAQMISTRITLGISINDMETMTGVDAKYIERWEQEKNLQEIPYFQRNYVNAVRLIALSISHGRLTRLAEVVYRIAMGRGWTVARQKNAWVQAIVDALEVAGLISSIDLGKNTPDNPHDETWSNHEGNLN